MKTVKQILALLLVVCICAAFVPGSVFTVNAATPTVRKAVAVSATEMLIYFSEPVNNQGADFCGLRWFNSSNQLLWRSAAGVVSTAEAGSPLQYFGTVDYFDAAHTILKWTVDWTTTDHISRTVLGSDVAHFNDLRDAVSGTDTGVADYTAAGTLQFFYAPSGAIGIYSVSDNIMMGATRSPLTAGSVPEITDASAIGYNQLLVSFDQPVTITPGHGDTFYLQWVDSANSLRWTNDAGDAWGGESASTNRPMQYGVSPQYYNDEHTKLILTVNYTPSGTIPFTADDTMAEALTGEGAFANYVGTQGFSLKIKALTTLITAATGNADLSPNNVLTAPAVADELTVTGAEVISQNSIKVSFSEPIAIDLNVTPNPAEAGPYIYLAYVDGTGEVGVNANSNQLRWNGSWVLDPDDATNKTVIWTINPALGMSLSNITGYTGYFDGCPLSDSTALACKLGISEQAYRNTAASGAGSVGSSLIWDGRIDNITTADGNVRLSANYCKADKYDQCLVPIASYGHTPKVSSAIAVNNSQLIVTFSEPVAIIGTPFMALRVVDDANILMWENEDGSDIGHEGAAYPYPLQWEGLWQWENSEHTAIRWTLLNDYMIEDVAAIIDCTGDFAAYAPYNTMFCISEITTPAATDTEDGTLENIAAANGSKLCANYIAVGGSYDCAYIAVTKDASRDEAHFNVKAVTAVNETQILVEFTEAATITDTPFMALRIVDGMNNLIWESPDGTAQGYESATLTVPLQIEGTWAWENEEHTIIRWTLLPNHTVSDINEVITRTGSFAKYDPYNTMFCIAEKTTPEGADTEDGTLENITSASGEKLRANKIVAGTSYDANYKAVESDLTLDSGAVHILRAVAASKTTIVLEFSAAVNWSGSPFIGLRIVDNGNNLLWSNADGSDIGDESETRNKPLQWEGSFALSEDHTKLVWSLSDSYGIKDVADIINRTGKQAVYGAYNTRFCIEENLGGGDDPDDGGITNLKDAAGRVVRANRTVLGAFNDGVYVKVITDLSYAIPKTGDIAVYALAAVCVVALGGASLLVCRRKKNLG